MLGKTQIKYIQSLRQKKYRHLHGAYLIGGEKIVGEYILNGYPLGNIYAVSEWIARNEQLLRQKKRAVTEVTQRELEQLSDQTTPNQVVAVAKMPPPAALEVKQLPETGLHLVLECIQDPGNLGTIIRTADWFGVDSVLCSPDCADAYNPKTVQSAMGSLARVSVMYFESTEYMTGLLSRAPLPVYATSPEGDNIFTEKLNSAALVLLGNESKGLSQAMMTVAARKISIPRFGKAESLNVAVAAGIVLARFRTA